MNYRIIYQTDSGELAIVIPAAECGLTVEQIAVKDVPAGKPYKIVGVADFPEDAEFFGAWEADFSSPDGYGMGHEAWFAQEAS